MTQENIESLATSLFLLLQLHIACKRMTKADTGNKARDISFRIFCEFSNVFIDL